MNFLHKVSYILLVAGFSLLLCPGRAEAQRISVGTNAVEWLNLGTVNGELGVGINRFFSFHVGARYNNWSFRKSSPEDRFEEPTGESEKQFENRKRAFSAGLRYWPWYYFSGLWFYLRGQWMEYNRGGLINHSAEEGEAYGVGIGAGYSYMLSKHWNVEFGIGLWGGKKEFTKYNCTNCGRVIGEGKKSFILPDDAFVSIVYLF